MSSAQNADPQNHKLNLKVIVTQQKQTDTKDSLQDFLIFHKPTEGYSSHLGELNTPLKPARTTQGKGIVHTPVHRKQP